MKGRLIKAFSKKPLAAGIATALLGMSYSANAVKFELGDFEVSFDSTFSAGASWRVEDRDFDLIGKVNNPRFDWEGYHPAFNPKYTSADIWATDGNYSSNGDNGNLNFDSGSPFSKVLKGVHELEVRYENYGVFVRGMYFKDYALDSDDRDWTNPISGSYSDPCRDSKAADYACSDIRLLDAFVFADFDLADGEIPLSIRVGDQVVSWGESTFISHGISSINPVDISRLQAPGAELKEAFIPVGMVWGSIGLTENLNVDMFYQYDWEATRVPVGGTYFASNDFVGEGGYYNNIQLGFNGNPDMDLDFLISSLNSFLPTAGALGLSAEQTGEAFLAYGTKVAVKPKGGNALMEPDDGGQYGIKLAYFVPELNDTEFGLYYMNYHSRRPLISGVASNFTQQAIGEDLAFLATNTITEDNYHELQTFTKSIIEYPEDIKLYGASFNTNIGNTAFAGEFSYRQDEPLQIDDVELLYAGMPEQLAKAGLRDDLEGISQMPVPEPGEYAQGFITRDTMQLQATATHLFGPTLGSDQLTFLVETGVVQIDDMPDQCDLRLNAAGTARSGACGDPAYDMDAGLHVGISNGPETNQFASATSWGYRMLLKADYTNVFYGVNVSPRVVFSHDVNGTTPDPMFLFIEDRKSANVTLSFDYQSTWSADLSYNSYWGGGTANALSDRDFVSFNVKYSI